MAVPTGTSEPPVGVRAQRLAERRVALLDAAVRVIRREGDRVAMEDIATEAGISRPILYRHFGDVSGLYDAVARRFSEELGTRLLRPVDEVASGRALLHRQVVTFLAFVADDPNLYRFLVRRAPVRRRSGPHRNAFSLRVATHTADFLVASGWERPAAIVASDLLVGGLEATADRWLDEPVGSYEEVADLVTTLAWSGFKALARAAAPDDDASPT